uniref:Uncharacterized protein n=1 Tax=Micrurus corallinus TaxID=54390 RepID=A0A2D4FW50_MICCO
MVDSISFSFKVVKSCRTSGIETSGVRSLHKKSMASFSSVSSSCSSRERRDAGILQNVITGHYPLTVVLCVSFKQEKPRHEACYSMQNLPCLLIFSIQASIYAINIYIYQKTIDKKRRPV